MHSEFYFNDLGDPSAPLNDHHALSQSAETKVHRSTNASSSQQMETPDKPPSVQDVAQPSPPPLNVGPLQLDDRQVV